MGRKYTAVFSLAVALGADDAPGACILPGTRMEGGIKAKLLRRAGAWLYCGDQFRTQDLENK